MRARSIAAGLAALALGAGVAACGGTQVSEPAPSTTPEITVSDEDLVGLSGEDAALTEDTTSTTSTTSTTPDTSSSSSTDTSGTAATPDTATPAPAPAPADTGGTATPAPAPSDTGGTATPDTGDTADDTGDTGGAGFDDFCAQNPGAC